MTIVGIYTKYSGIFLQSSATNFEICVEMYRLCWTFWVWGQKAEKIRAGGRTGEQPPTSALFSLALRPNPPRTKPYNPMLGTVWMCDTRAHMVHCGRKGGPEEALVFLCSRMAVGRGPFSEIRQPSPACTSFFGAAAHHA